MDLCHRDGSLKSEVASNPAKYIHKVRRVPPLPVPLLPPTARSETAIYSRIPRCTCLHSYACSKMRLFTRQRKRHYARCVQPHALPTIAIAGPRGGREQQAAGGQARGALGRVRAVW